MIKSLFFSVCMIVLLPTSGLSLFAEGSEKKAESPPVPILKKGDNVFFRISDFNSTTPGADKRNPPIYDVFELRGKDYQTLPVTNGEFLVINDENITYQIDARKTKKDQPFQAAVFQVPAIWDELKTNIAEHPEDRSKWTVKVSDTKKEHVVTLTFAGIARVYRLQSISVPRNSDHRKHKKYDNGHAPMFRVYVDKNGVNVGQIQVRDASWEIDFPRSESNLWSVREGLNDSYLIRLRDRNTNLREHPIMERGGIKPEEFSKGTISEELDSLDAPGKAVRFVFAPAEKVVVEKDGKETKELIWDGIKWYYRLKTIIVM